ncbi:MAG TPA: DNA-binding response regulator [Algoriphagus sp.]|jgi:DNA-binding LytR/AlgR family response regulator|uniref:LytR/AlgR family response regulator transcription factor n=1 Tax=unclassified Algoriphagus TaxID=2641541 RepID=UPI000C3DBAA1|nr:MULTISPECIES: LytTR family DNA-binding domain-containing protein [unclassified Algoriphagus]MAL12609.1 DNA-binding response regulator [Algoriphagus sp.]MAN88400.1 DNA-binding response regulator [Algoriphagus sp.]QYH37554.1 response regulator transcription factor [Algoriphagus sp. NBT04N3]HAD52853.1 DNA-binding response regulator [Algoriphagus sp.]HAH36151.1 DNA-binding response regulator [Algoriphagus sp.]|tara:strand:- start:491 stop:1237 length:747 start_codon:yes stop_codon:yes gene_type:complete
MKLKCIAVDDEPLALELVCKYIQQTAFLDLVGKFSSAIDALAFLNKEEVQLIFMDIQMPDLSGMELARVLDGKKTSDKTRIIFATAYHQFAIEGYKVDALDYLLKPYSYEDFLNAATKAYNYFEKQENKIPNPATTPTESSPEYIFLKVEYQLVKVMLSDITHVEAYKDYVKVHLKSKPNPLLSLTSLKSMEELLPTSKFMRVHRSYIIGLDHIESVSKNVITIGTHHISVSDNYKEPFLEFMGKWMN